MKAYLTERGLARFDREALQLLSWFRGYWSRANSEKEAEVLEDLVVINATELALMGQVSSIKTGSDLPLGVTALNMAGAVWKTDTALMHPCHTARRIAHGRPDDIRVWDGFFFTGDAQKATQTFLGGPGDLRFADLQEGASFATYTQRVDASLDKEAAAKLSDLVSPMATGLADGLARLRILIAYRRKQEASSVRWPIDAR